MASEKSPGQSAHHFTNTLHTMKHLIPVLLLLALCGCDKDSAQSQNASAKKMAYLDKPLKGIVSQHGLYKLVRSGGIVNDPSTSTGKAVSSPVIQQVKSTQRIPLVKGAQMYLQYRIWSFPDTPAFVDLRRTLKHPPMTLPDGTVSTGSDYTMKGRVSVNQVVGYTGYGLDEEYELVEGDWVFEIWFDDKKIIEQKFTTYRPDKEELAALQLQLNKKISNNPKSAPKPFSRTDWPRKVIGEKP